MKVGFPCPIQQLLDEVWHKLRSRPDMHRHVSVEHAGITAAESARLDDQTLCHQLVGFQKVFHGVGVIGHDLVVGFIGILDLFDFGLLTREHLALDDGGHLAD